MWQVCTVYHQKGLRIFKCFVAASLGLVAGPAGYTRESVGGRRYERHAQIVDIKHRLVSVATGLLLIGSGAGGVGNAAPLEVVQPEALVGSDDATLEGGGDEPLPG